MYEKRLKKIRLLKEIAVGLALFLAGCLPVRISFSPRPVTPSPDNGAGLIAYLGVDGNIYTIDPQGANQQLVTNDARLEAGADGTTRSYQAPTWSPDGRRLAFIQLNSMNGQNGSAHVLISDPDGKGQVDAFQSEREFPFYLYWSPDSQKLTFLTGGAAANDLILRIVADHGGEAQELDHGSPYYWAWGPGSQDIFVHSGGAARDSANARLAFLGVDSQTAGQKLDLHPTTFQAPDWSSNGEELLLAAEKEDGSPALMLTNRRGEVKKELAKYDGAIAFGWSPDGKRIAFLTNQDSGFHEFYNTISILDPANPEDKKTFHEDVLLAFFWSPDSQRIAYFVPVVVPTGKQSIRFPSQASSELKLGLRVLDVESGETQEAAVFKPSDDFLNIIPFFDQYQRSMTLWSPDSKNLVISVNDSQNGPGIYVVDAKQVNPMRLISSGLLAFWSTK
jgi:TolB protein